MESSDLGLEGLFFLLPDPFSPCLLSASEPFPQTSQLFLCSSTLLQDKLNFDSSARPKPSARHRLGDPGAHAPSHLPSPSLQDNVSRGWRLKSRCLGYKRFTLASTKPSSVLPCLLLSPCWIAVVCVAGERALLQVCYHFKYSHFISLQ